VLSSKHSASWISLLSKSLSYHGHRSPTVVHGLAGKFVKIGTVCFFSPQLDAPSFGVGFMMNRGSAGTDCSLAMA
jgi:hypothetical protein